MNSKLEKLFGKLETLEDQRQDVLDEIKNLLYDLNLESEEDEYDDDWEDEEDEQQEGTTDEC